MRAFLERRWDLVETAQLDELARAYAAEGPEGSLRVSEALRRHALALAPETEEEREADMRAHVAWRRMLDGIAQRGFRGR